MEKRNEKGCFVAIRHNTAVIQAGIYICTRGRLETTGVDHMETKDLEPHYRPPGNLSGSRSSEHTCIYTMIYDFNNQLRDGAHAVATMRTDGRSTPSYDIFIQKTKNFTKVLYISMKT
uniref:Uncharacterized protein LOC111100838 n=1 Tax=Crassostrea virginica TaxID=6565 RepID=A0A8B8AB08_CRAVI|nr:uncharacterized protein LOC111100838 [Crassostrea virginica]